MIFLLFSKCNADKSEKKTTKNDQNAKRYFPFVICLINYVLPRIFVEYIFFRDWLHAHVESIFNCPALDLEVHSASRTGTTKIALKMAIPSTRGIYQLSGYRTGAFLSEHVQFFIYGQI